MTRQDGATSPKFKVVGPSEPTGISQTLREMLADGTALITTGGAIAIGFGVEAGKSFMTSESNGRWWFILSALAGIAAIFIGFWQRVKSRRRMRVGIVVTARDPRRGMEGARSRESKAEKFCLKTCLLTLGIGVDLPDDGPCSKAFVEALADETIRAMSNAEQLTPSAVRIALVPTMPLHVAFWFGARLGHTHAGEVMVHSIPQGGDKPAHFPAIPLRAGDPQRQPLVVGRLESIDGGDLASVALALDLQCRGDQFFDPVMDTCRKDGIGYILPIRGQSTLLAEDGSTFTSVVDQICRAWRDAALSSSARTGQHTIFLSGPTAISVALGARLASQEQGLWTAYTFDLGSGTYEAIPSHTAS